MSRTAIKTLSLWALAFVWFAGPSAAADKPNVLFIAIDDELTEETDTTVEEIAAQVEQHFAEPRETITEVVGCDSKLTNSESVFVDNAQVFDEPAIKTINRKHLVEIKTSKPFPSREIEVNPPNFI